MRTHALLVLKNILLGILKIKYPIGGLSYFLQIDFDDIPIKIWKL